MQRVKQSGKQSLSSVNQIKFITVTKRTGISLDMDSVLPKRSRQAIERVTFEPASNMDVWLVKTGKGKSMSDTGPHTPLAGPRWHNAMQPEILHRGWTWRSLTI